MTTDLTVVQFVPPPSYTGDPETWSRALNEWLTEQVGLLQSLASGHIRWQNLRAKLFSQVQTPSGASPQVFGLAGAAPVLAHNLGKIPEVFLWSSNIARVTPANKFDLHATTANRANWSDTHIELTLSHSGTNPTPLVDILVL